MSLPFDQLVGVVVIITTNYYFLKNIVSLVNDNNLISNVYPKLENLDGLLWQMLPLKKAVLLSC